MRPLLMMLFGVGMAIQLPRFQALGIWPVGYIRRMAWLLLIGLIHGFLLWWGDILAHYALVGMVCAALLTFSPKVTRILVNISIAVLALAALGGIGYMLLPPSAPSAGQKLPYEWLTPKGEVAIFAGSNVVDIFAARALYALLSLFMLMLISFLTVPFFLLGVRLREWGVWERPSQHPRLTKILLAIGLGLGLPINALPLTGLLGNRYERVVSSIDMIWGFVFALGLGTLWAIIVEKGLFSRLTNVLARVGRVAMSVYLLQSLLATLIFYGYGFGQFNRHGPLAQLGFVVLIWCLCVGFALWWTRRFDEGPVEKIWRDLAGRQRAGETVAPTPPPVLRQSSS